MPDNIIPMGKVVGAFGILGWLKIKTDTQDNDSLGKYPKLLLLINNNWVLHKIEKFFVKADIFHVKLENMSDRDQAISLRGTLVGIPRNEFPQLTEDEYYWTDLIGLSVLNLANENLGTVENLMETGASAVLVIKSGDQERLIPFVSRYIIKVDKEQIVVDWELDY